MQMVYVVGRCPNCDVDRGGFSFELPPNHECVVAFGRVNLDMYDRSHHSRMLGPGEA
jgi:hypothetical protein